MRIQKKISQGSVALISWLIIVFINFFQLLFVKSSVLGKLDWDDLMYYPITSLTIGILLIYLFLLPIFKKIRTLKIGFQIPLFIAHGLSYTTIYIIVIFFQISLWSDNLDLDSFSITVQKFFYTDFHNIAKNYFFLLAIYIAVEYVQKREEALITQKELENQLKEAKLQALESKLHPHFLFNAFNGITSLVNENPKKAENAIVELSDLLRFSLEGNLQKPISLEEELELLEKYLSIEKMRYEEQLEVKITIAEDVDLKKAIMPPMILQPIVDSDDLDHRSGYLDHPL
ncbi:sensor histidine kinase, partial [Aquiflexum lacus]|uniref:sensor histidine kinase n=1 Tax=Aquiflexum lacus TaxID=2483805 RepID=UPI001893C27F